LSREFHTLEAASDSVSSKKTGDPQLLVVVLTGPMASLPDLAQELATEMRISGALAQNEELEYAPATSRRFIISSASLGERIEDRCFLLKRTRSSFILDQAQRMAETLQHENQVLFVQIKPQARILNKFASAVTTNGNLRGNRKLSDTAKQLQGEILMTDTIYQRSIQMNIRSGASAWLHRFGPRLQKLLLR
jgi:hypothetical protein